MDIGKSISTFFHENLNPINYWNKDGAIGKIKAIGIALFDITLILPALTAVGIAFKEIGDYCLRKKVKPNPPEVAGPTDNAAKPIFNQPKPPQNINIQPKPPQNNNLQPKPPQNDDPAPIIKKPIELNVELEPIKTIYDTLPPTYFSTEEFYVELEEIKNKDKLEDLDKKIIFDEYSRHKHVLSPAFDSIGDSPYVIEHKIVLKKIETALANLNNKRLLDPVLQDIHMNLRKALAS